MQIKPHVIVISRGFPNLPFLQECLVYTWDSKHLCLRAPLPQPWASQGDHWTSKLPSALFSLVPPIAAIIKIHFTTITPSPLSNPCWGSCIYFKVLHIFFVISSDMTSVSRVQHLFIISRHKLGLSFAGQEAFPSLFLLLNLEKTLWNAHSLLGCNSSGH